MDEGLILRKKEWIWITKDKQWIPVKELEDKHLRNIALFLMDLGYGDCCSHPRNRVRWLHILRQEWARRKTEGLLKEVV